MKRNTWRQDDFAGESRPRNLESCSTPTLQGDGASRPRCFISPLNIFSLAVTAALEAPQVARMLERDPEAVRVRGHFA